MIGSPGSLRRSRGPRPAPVALALIVALATGEVQAARIALPGARPMGGDDLAGYTSAERRLLEQEQASFLESRIGPPPSLDARPYQTLRHGPDRITTSSPPINSPWMRAPIGIPVTLDEAVEPTGVANWHHGRPIATAQSLSPAVTGPVADAIDPASPVIPRPAALALQNPTPTPEPATSVLALGLIVAFAGRPRAIAPNPDRP